LICGAQMRSYPTWASGKLQSSEVCSTPTWFFNHRIYRDQT
jgi:hypothetical protein